MSNPIAIPERGGTSSLLAQQAMLATAVLPVLVLSAAAVFGGADRRRDRDDSAVAAARRAAQRAAEAFYAADQAQQALTVRVAAYANLVGDREAHQVVAAYGTLTDASDRVHAHYLTLGDVHRVDEPTFDPATGHTAAQAFDAVTVDLDRARQQLAAFEAAHANQLAAAERAAAAVPAQVEAARRQHAAAATAAAAVRADGLTSPALDAAEAAAAEALTVLDRGLAALGTAQTLAAAKTLTVRAGEVARLARELPQVRRQVQDGLRSALTRLEVLTGAGERVEDTMGALRRSYREVCWADVAVQAPQRSAQLAGVAQELQRAQVAATQGRWTDAAADLARGRAMMTAVDHADRAAAERLVALDLIKTDPKAAGAHAWFVLKDAQRAAVNAGVGPTSQAVRTLDALVGLLERAEAGLRGVHPDYYAYLVALRSVEDGARKVVADLRAGRLTR